MNEVLIISPQSGKRSQLRQLLSNSPLFDSVITKSGVDDGIFLGPPPKCVLLCCTLPDAEIKSILELRSKKRIWNETVYILMAGGEETSRNDLADHFFAGFHGVLNDPMTEEALTEVLNLASNVANSETQHRMRAAAGLIVSEVFREGASGSFEGNLWQEVREACNKFKRVTGESITCAVVNPLVNNEATSTGSYTGVSKRVRRLTQERLRKFVRGMFVGKRDQA